MTTRCSVCPSGTLYCVYRRPPTRLFARRWYMRCAGCGVTVTEPYTGYWRAFFHGSNASGNRFAVALLLLSVLVVVGIVLAVIAGWPA